MKAYMYGEPTWAKWEEWEEIAGWKELLHSRNPTDRFLWEQEYQGVPFPPDAGQEVEAVKRQLEETKELLRECRELLEYQRELSAKLRYASEKKSEMLSMMVAEYKRVEKVIEQICPKSITPEEEDGIPYNERFAMLECHDKEDNE